MKTNISKKELTTRLDGLLEHVQQVGACVGNPELNYMTDTFRDQYADCERMLEALIVEIDNLK